MKEYVKLTLEKRTWSSQKTGGSGENYCFNNQSSKLTEVFGHKASVSVFIPGQDANNSVEPQVYIWLNDMTDTMYEAFVEEYGEEIYYHIPSKKELTVEEYNNLGIDTTQQAQASQF